jgi:TonB family protein
LSTTTPEIPDDLKSQELKTSVRVRVVIEANGEFTTSLRSSSGNPEVDRLVLDALGHWKWRPAMRDGVAIESTKYFRFDFNVD